MIGFIAQQDNVIHTCDPRRAVEIQGVRVCENKSQARQLFNGAKATSLERGWTIIYDGPPLFG